MNLEMLTTDIMLTVQENIICLKPGKEMYICTLFLCYFITTTKWTIPEEKRF